MKTTCTHTLALITLTLGLGITGVTFADGHHADTPHVPSPAAEADTTTSSPASGVSMTQVAAETATLKNSESNTMAKQNQAKVNSAQQQAKDTQQAGKAQVTGATAEMAVSVATTSASVAKNSSQMQAQEDETNAQAQQQAEATKTSQMNQGVQQTEEVADQVRQSASAVAGSMSSIVQSTKV